MKIKYLIPFLVLVLVFGFLLNSCCFSNDSLTPVESEQSKQSTALMCSENTVTKMLKAPSTAKFPYLTDDGVEVTKLDTDKYLVSSYVDSENSFGAMIRITYTVTIILQGEDSEGNTNYKYKDLNMFE